MRNFKVLLSYDGSRYKGWQRLGDSDNTIQGKLENVLSRMTRTAVEVIGSGRTDAGAHALGQTANFHCETGMSCGEIRAYLRQYLPEDIGVISVEEAEPRFHSRFNAVEKTYRYRVWNSDLPCVVERKYVWPAPSPKRMQVPRSSQLMRRLRFSWEPMIFWLSAPTSISKKVRFGPSAGFASSAWDRRFNLL